MILYLVQHGEATTKEISPDRPLTEKGKSDVLRISKFLKEAGVKINMLWHSSKLRAIQTAQIFAEIIEVNKENILERQDLSPLDPVNNVQKEIVKNDVDLMIVGHLPFLQRLTSLLLVGSESEVLVRFSQGGVVCLKQKEDKWHLVWEVIPELIPG